MHRVLVVLTTLASSQDLASKDAAVQTTSSLPFKDALLGSLAAVAAGLGTLSLLTHVGVVLGALLLGGYALNSNRQTAAGGAGNVALYAGLGAGAGLLLSLAVGLACALLVDGVAWMTVAAQFKQVVPGWRSSHLWGLLAGLLGALPLVALGGLAGLLVVGSRVPQDGLARDPVGTLVQGGLAVGLVTLVLGPAAVAAVLFIRAGAFWFLER